MDELLDVSMLISKGMVGLRPRERNVIKLRFGLGQPEMNLRVIAERLKVSRERVRQIEKKALLKMRRQIEYNAIKPSELPIKIQFKQFQI